MSEVFSDDCIDGFRRIARPNLTPGECIPEPARHRCSRPLLPGMGWPLNALDRGLVRLCDFGADQRRIAGFRVGVDGGGSSTLCNMDEHDCRASRADRRPGHRGGWRLRDRARGRVPRPVIAANRAQLAALVATNILGQNAPAIAATEAQYGQMWASKMRPRCMAVRSTPFRTVNPLTAADRNDRHRLPAGHRRLEGETSCLSLGV